MCVAHGCKQVRQTDLITISALRKHPSRFLFLTEKANEQLGHWGGHPQHQKNRRYVVGLWEGVTLAFRARCLPAYVFTIEADCYEYRLTVSNSKCWKKLLLRFLDLIICCYSPQIRPVAEHFIFIYIYTYLYLIIYIYLYCIYNI